MEVEILSAPIPQELVKKKKCMSFQEIVSAIPLSLPEVWTAHMFSSLCARMKSMHHDKCMISGTSL